VIQLEYQNLVLLFLQKEMNSLYVWCFEENEGLLAIELHLPFVLIIERKIIN